MENTGKQILLALSKNTFKAGDKYPIFEIDGFTFGINICYDLNFPDCAKAISDQGAKLLVCPSNNMLERSIAEKWKLKHNSSRSERAVETGLWILSSDVTGEIDGRIGYGPTAVINPKGEVVKQRPLMQPGLITHQIEFN